MAMTDRRRVIQSTGALMISAVVGGKTLSLSPREARAAGANFQVIHDPELIGLVEAIGEVLVPGARHAGIALFIDSQLARPASESLLLLRYLDINPPYWPFYRDGLRASDAAARRLHGQGFTALTPAQQTDLIQQIRQGTPAGWQGPPSPRFYLALRSDAVDVVYGTEQGFAALGLPYMAHIAPAKQW